MVNFLLKYLSPASEVSDQLINWYTAKGGEGKTRVSIPKFAGAELAAMGNKRKDKLFSVRFEAPGKLYQMLRERTDLI